MANKDDAHYLVDMLVNAQLVAESTAGVTFDSFLGDREKQDSVAFRISIIGEAARYVSHATRVRVPDLPWPKITGMRHRIAHDYNEIDLDIVWRVATLYVPELLQVLTDFLSREGLMPPDGGAAPERQA